MKRLRVLDLFSGIGGFSLGLESTGLYETVGFCESDPYCREVLAHHWPGLPIWLDVRRLTAESLVGLRPDLICGGFPCQDVSKAGRGGGIKGARSGLWSEFARLVEELRPDWVLAENVGALRTRGIDRVCSDLEAEGYTVWPLVVGAWAVGAPHARERVFVVAHGDGDALRLERQRRPTSRQRDGETETRGRSAVAAHPGPPALGDRVVEGLEGLAWNAEDSAERRPAAARPARPTGLSCRWPLGVGEEQHDWEEPRVTQSPMGGALHGLSDRLARRANKEALKALGNAVVPQIVAVIGRAIHESA